MNGIFKESTLASGKKNTEVSPMLKTDAELRAEIEEKVRREMIEKQVREEMGSTQQPDQNEKSY